MAPSTLLSKVNPALRIVLGLIYFVFGINFFLHFIPAPPPDAASKAGHFLGGLFESGYFFVFLKVLEITFGLLLIINVFTPLVLLFLFTISTHILLFHSFLAPVVPSLAIALIIFILNVYLIWVYRAYYLPLVKINRKNVVTE